MQKVLDWVDEDGNTEIRVYRFPDRDEQVNIEVQDQDGDFTDVYLSAEVGQDVGRAILRASAAEGVAAPSIPSTLSDPRAEWNAHVFQLAAKFGRLVVFDYQKDHSTVIERRKLRPETVSVTGVATGHDLAREDIRAFRLDRVQGWARVG